MKEIVYDVLIATIILSILAVAIGLFRQNLNLIDKSSDIENDGAQILEDGSESSSLYLGADIITYLSTFSEDKREDIKVVFTSGFMKVEGSNWSDDVKNITNYLKSNSLLSTKFKYKKSTKTFTKIG